MPEFHQPMCLDAATEILIEDGQPERAAYALGAARTMTVHKLHPAFQREPHHDRLQATLEAQLGADDAATQMRAGTDAGAEAAVAVLAGWLTD
jgi:hypothetical protein